jgi:outer membrane protein assembly factor BamB
VIAFTGDGKKELWRFSTPSSANISGVAVANGVVYFQSTQNGNLYALDAATGAQLGVFQIGGGTSGPAISRGHVYVGTGPLALTDVLPGSVLALSLD